MSSGNELLLGYTMKRVIFSIIASMLFLLLSPVVPQALAADVTLAWDANPPEDNVGGYNLYYYKTGSPENPDPCEDAHQGPSPIVLPLEVLGNPESPEYTLIGLRDDEVYHFVVTAYNNAGESNPSNEENLYPNEEEPPTKVIGEEGGGCFITVARYPSRR